MVLSECVAKVDLELRDPRGRTPLLLAVTLGHLEATKLLLSKGCSTQSDMLQGWTGEMLINSMCKAFNV